MRGGRLGAAVPNTACDGCIYYRTDLNKGKKGGRGREGEGESSGVAEVGPDRA